MDKEDWWAYFVSWASEPAGPSHPPFSFSQRVTCSFKSCGRREKKIDHRFFFKKTHRSNMIIIK